MPFKDEIVNIDEPVNIVLSLFDIIEYICSYYNSNIC